MPAALRLKREVKVPDVELVMLPNGILLETQRTYFGCYTPKYMLDVGVGSTGIVETYMACFSVLVLS